MEHGSNCSRNHSGVTIVELLLVIAIIAFLGATTIPIASGFLIRNQHRNKTNELITSLSSAKLNSMSGKEGSEWGVSTDSNSITLFKGSSYAARDPSFDQTYSVPASISVTSDEVVFDVLTGNPDAVASISITSNSGDVRVVEVNEVGSISID